MKMKKRAWWIVLLLLCLALPALAQAGAPTPRESAREVWRETGLLLPIPTAAHDIAYATESDALAQVSFSYDGDLFVLRLQKTPALADVSGGYAGFDVAMADEEYEDYQCVTADNGSDRLAWWFDAERSVSGALRCSSDGVADFHLVLYDVLAGLRRGFCYAGSLTYEAGAFSLRYPLVQADDDALTEKLNANLLQAVQAVAASFAPDARLDNAYLSVEITGKVFTAEWGGLLVAPGAPYEDYHLFTAHVDGETGELAPLRALLDTDELAEKTYPQLIQFMVSQDWDDDAVDEAQREYLAQLSLDDWKGMLRRADFPTEEGWPPVFSAWRDGGYFRDGNEDELPCLLLYIVVPHALQNQISLSIPFAQLDMELMDALHVR